jgi:hypothetical protein
VTNPFSTKALLPTFSTYPVTKGDTPGHPFHGNQYTKEQAIADIHEGRAFLESALKKGFDGDPSHGSLSDDDRMFDARHALSKGHAFLGSAAPDVMNGWDHLNASALAHTMENPDTTGDGDAIARDTKAVIAASKAALP